MKANEIIKKVKKDGEWVGEVNNIELLELQKNGYFAMGIEGGRYRVVDNPNKF